MYRVVTLPNIVYSCHQNVWCTKYFEIFFLLDTFDFVSLYWNSQNKVPVLSCLKYPFSDNKLDVNDWKSSLKIIYKLNCDLCYLQNVRKICILHFCNGLLFTKIIHTSVCILYKLFTYYNTSQKSFIIRFVNRKTSSKSSRIHKRQRVQSL